MALASAVALTVLVLIAAGCGGGSSSPGVASVGGGDAPLPAAQRTWPALYHCYATHGFPTYRPIGSPAVPSAPPIYGWWKMPNGNYGITPGYQKRFSGPKWDAANKACEPLFPGKRLTPAQVAVRVAQARKVARCMRAHGMPNLPDPNSTGLIPLASSAEDSAPKFLSAQSACQGLMKYGLPFLVPYP